MVLHSLNEWQSLQEQIEVVTTCTEGRLTLTPEQLQLYETEASESETFQEQLGDGTQFILPQGYKDFCQIFGSGMFVKRMFHIRCPDLDNPDDLEFMLLELQPKFLNCYRLNQEIEELLEFAYLFGLGECVHFIFDLRTYSFSDRSYSIYGIYEEENTVGLYYLERDFFKFIRDICIGDRTQREFNKLLIGISEDMNLDDPLFSRGDFVPC